MCKIFKAYTHETVLYLTINTRKQKQIRQKTKLSPQGPQWSRHSVARVRDVAASIPPFLNLGNVYGTYPANMGRQENIVFYW